jgi:dolichyl-phosphate-mannose--protein O-mannosyl transferase
VTSLAPDRPRYRRLPAWAPLIVLALVSLLSLGARAYRLDAPCVSPCTTTAEHVLMFDESYYVNAAQVIDGIRPQPGEFLSQAYATAPPGTDPNAEHPQGAKLVIAAAIDLFGDGPFAWRIGSLLFGSLAIAGLYALVRSAGGGPWAAVGAATLLAADNVMIVSGRMAMLDVYALAPLLWGVALYLRGRILPVAAAAVLLAVADSMKEVSVYALVVLGLLELCRAGLRARDPGLPPAWAWRPALGRLAVVVPGSAALFAAALWAMGLLATPYKAPPGGLPRPGQHLLISGGPFAHLSYIVRFAKAFNDPHGLGPGASYPWQWLLDRITIDYSGIYPTPVAARYAIHPAVSFTATISPPILALAIPALVVCAWRGLRRRPESQSPADVQLAVLAVAWFAGTWVPFALQSALFGRISYLYYMILVMPGIYLAVTYLASLLWRQRRIWLRGLVLVGGLAVLAAAVLMFPFTAIS